MDRKILITLLKNVLTQAENGGSADQLQKGVKAIATWIRLTTGTEEKE